MKEFLIPSIEIIEIECDEIISTSTVLGPSYGPADETINDNPFH